MATNYETALRGAGIQLNFAAQQADVFSSECSTVMQYLRRTCAEFSPHVWSELFASSKMPQSGIEVCLKFVLLTFGQEPSWADFLRSWPGKYQNVIEGMRLFAPEAMSEDVSAVMLPLWKRHAAISLKLKKCPKGNPPPSENE